MYAFEGLAGVVSHVFFATPPSLPRFLSFLFLFLLSTDLFSVTDAQGCCREGLMAGVLVGKATGVVYLPGLGFMCSPGG